MVLCFKIICIVSLSEDQTFIYLELNYLLFIKNNLALNDYLYKQSLYL